MISGKIRLQRPLTGARFIQWGALAEHLDTLPRDKKIIFYCYIGEMSAQAAETLSALGYSYTYNVIEGTDEYPFDLVK